MTPRISLKAVALACISLLMAGLIAIGTTITQAFLYEMRNSFAAKIAADAQTLDAINKLRGTENAARAVTDAARIGAGATMIAAERTGAAIIAASQQQAKGVIDATTIATHPENEGYDSFTGPLLGEPTKKFAALNDQIGDLQLEVQSGIDLKTGLRLSEAERSERRTRIAVLEQQVAMVQRTSSKNIAGTVQMVMAAMGQSMGGFGGLYTLNTPPDAPTPPSRVQKVENQQQTMMSPLPKEYAENLAKLTGVSVERLRPPSFASLVESQAKEVPRPAISWANWAMEDPPARPSRLTPAER